ncbi:MAG: hypothetical protein IPM93_09260 [Candidatus Obscuribacter sp.]|nr:hypothetical protein [Candidatus Obscuribacter sp.]
MPPNLLRFYAAVNNSRGCFVFAIRNGPGFTPGYVGKTVQKTFREETFHATKRDIYNKILGLYKKGTPVLFFILTENGRGVARHIDHLETFLIQNAASANPFELQNIQRSGLGWNIRGILRGAGGQPSKAAKELRKMLQLAHPPKSEHRETEETEARRISKRKQARVKLQKGKITSKKRGSRRP